MCTLCVLWYSAYAVYVLYMCTRRVCDLCAYLDTICVRSIWLCVMYAGLCVSRRDYVYAVYDCMWCVRVYVYLVEICTLWYTAYLCTSRLDDYIILHMTADVKRISSRYMCTYVIMCVSSRKYGRECLTYSSRSDILRAKMTISMML